MEILNWIKHILKRSYIVFWHELSLDPRVRTSSYDDPPENEIILPQWKQNVIRARRIYLLSLHMAAVFGLYYCLTGQVMLFTYLWAILLATMSLIGSNAGAHRLWSHGSFKATWQLRLILIIFQTLSVQYTAYNWARDHRLHHKYSDTDLDPHNANRGFFFSHVGWTMILRLPETNKKIQEIYTKDLEADKIVMYQETHYTRMVLLINYFIPTFVAWYFWNENWWIAYTVCVQLRFVLCLHGTFTINSVAHMWGMKPYDRHMKAVENMFVSFASGGDGWHNYHHVFPWDYKNSEYWDYKLNISTLFIDFFALVGWAYDLKTVPSKMIKQRVQRTGDGSHPVWGWQDKDVSAVDRKITKIKNVKNDEEVCRNKIEMSTQNGTF